MIKGSEFQSLGATTAKERLKTKVDGLKGTLRFPELDERICYCR
jgi:hypothetical protein